MEIWGRTVGALSYDKDTGLCAFQYDPSWIRTAIELSPVKLPLSNRIYQFPALSRETYRGLPGAFADSLPDDFGNALVDAWLARMGRDKDSFSGLERLLYTGRRGMGAFEYFPSIDTGLESPEVVELDSLIDMAQSVLNQRAKLSRTLASDTSSESLYALFQVGTSAGGARPKAVIGINKTRTEIRSGQVDLPEGFEHYLLKFDGVAEHPRTKETFGEPQGAVIGINKTRTEIRSGQVDLPEGFEHYLLKFDGVAEHPRTKELISQRNLLGLNLSSLFPCFWEALISLFILDITIY